ncbi:hypothetical protein J1605_019778 [Eschrichtius robustus]|uniref:Uncharacterized protein n=1 Tax=Eschrichtius robustus TaxID=9764 RepID=A0AB34HPT1_ESCRO|nr:hypothetical protein J1605_019778 [Eschrichtius robustus]
MTDCRGTEWPALLLVGSHHCGAGAHVCQNGISSLKNRLKKVSTTTGDGVARAFLKAQAAFFGSYRNALKIEPDEWSPALPTGSDGRGGDSKLTVSVSTVKEAVKAAASSSSAAC